MTRWLFHVPFGKYLTRSEDQPSIVKSCEAIAVELERQRCFKGSDFAARLRRAASVEDFYLAAANSVIDEIYDYADANRIWLEPVFAVRDEHETAK